MQSFTQLFNILTSITAIAVLVLSAVLLVRRKKIFSDRTALIGIFIVSLIAMIGSLIYSNSIGFPPCDLCWYQRIAMYPIAFISGFALLRKDTTIVPYITLLTGVGAAIALFHNIIYYTGINPIPCSATASCTARYVYEFGFMTIPLMSLSFFILILTILFHRKSIPTVK